MLLRYDIMRSEKPCEKWQVMFADQITIYVFKIIHSLRVSIFIIELVHHIIFTVCRKIDSLIEYFIVIDGHNQSIGVHIHQKVRI